MNPLTGFALSRRLGFLARLLYALSQQMHDVNDFSALRSARGRFRGFDNLGLARLYFLLDDFHYILAIFIAVFCRIPFTRHRFNKLLGHFNFLRRDVRIFASAFWQIERSGITKFIMK
ncbi:MAG: hypothetical protein E6J73_09335, partial [Deltaproteobacteria bacterium]